MTHPAPHPPPQHADLDQSGGVAEMRQRLDERNDLLALVAHELRNPLHALSLQVSVARLLAETQGASEVVSRIGKAQATLQRYIHRVTVLLDLLSHEGRDYPANRQQVDLGQALAGILEALAPEAQYRSVTVRYHAPASACHAVVDVLVLEQIVDNLMLNAFKHAACAHVDVTLRCEAGWAEIDIADDGRGIEENDQERVFGKFAVAENSGRGSGTGLGLWIVRRLSLVLGGSVLLASTPGQGSTFTLRFPLSQPVFMPT